MSKINNRKVRLDQRGMSLVEVSVTISLTVAISIAVVMFMITGMRTYATASAKAELLSLAQAAADRIGEDVMLSATADLNNRIDDANSPILGDPNGWVSDADTLILASAVEDQARNIVYADPANYVSYKNNIVYYLNNGTLYRRTLAANVTGNRLKTSCPPASATATCPADREIATDVTGFTVSYRNGVNGTVVPDESRSVEVSITMQRKNNAQTKVTYNSRTVFRND